MRLQDKVAIVTGGGSGIGRAIAFLFIQEGAKVVVADWSTQGGQETVDLIEKQGGQSVFVKTDVSKESDVKQMVDECVKMYGRVDILVNNAGIEKGEPLHEMTQEDWDQVMAVNARGVFLGSKHAIPHMLKQGKGKIINMASIAGIIGFAQSSAYCASKGAVIQLTKSMATEYAPQKINVNAIAPGVIRTAMTKEYLEDPTYAQMFTSQTPYPRLGEPEDIANGAVYLASDESDFVNGHVLVIDGGWVAK
ncbi:TPA: short-chain dehydrogenase [Candidatus Uhrbacteria bacterium]|uniref:Short-chain dehydrogenase/reductase SDR n=2 Tax=Candidatus Uhriibacteriota TaxID=1752732 RepID=A0A0G1Q9P7_9BACT|nr:MAG: Short-chain dehydrogenase/reductase SDR [Candidatus Uhrbacteria bacterium GW2011_GWF2_46_218]KKU41542.1 MAG: Short-chain dehydrogenase/reductase SDR [Candidatus Uhrbacteria bacterium GW2011_GWE2_46_68]HBK33543.1 short-chain dehydrogenase [Candidatus Uhrbacteria bacterium]HCB19502.1 short-chain dehydrogenase [Candidatus Uhrbacteria bacterium]